MMKRLVKHRHIQGSLGTHSAEFHIIRDLRLSCSLRMYSSYSLRLALELQSPSVFLVVPSKLELELSNTRILCAEQLVNNFGMSSWICAGNLATAVSYTHLRAHET